MSTSAPAHADVRQSLDSPAPIEWHEYQRIEEQLTAMFSPPLCPAEVQTCLIDCVERYELARVRQFLPLLIERDATQHLRDLSRAASSDRVIGP